MCEIKFKSASCLQLWQFLNSFVIEEIHFSCSYNGTKVRYKLVYTFFSISYFKFYIKQLFFFPFPFFFPLLPLPKQCFWCTPFRYLMYQVNQNWVQDSILAWLCPHFHQVVWMRQDSNPQPFHRDSSFLTTRPNWLTI